MFRHFFSTNSATGHVKWKSPDPFHAYQTRTYLPLSPNLLNHKAAVECSQIQPFYHYFQIASYELAAHICTALVSFYRGMQILYAISILCFFAILWAALSFARHIKASSRRIPAQHEFSIAPPQSNFRQILYVATETEAQSRIRHSDLHQQVRDITANKIWNMPPKSAPSKRNIGELPRVHSPKQQPSRKPPQSARHGAMAFLDPAYFNKDSGDLTDPYQTSPTSRYGHQ